MKTLNAADAYRLTLLLLLSFCSTVCCTAQEKVADFYARAGKANLATLWHAPKIYFVGAPEPWDDFPEPLGFIGENYQRFYIHYTSVVKDAQNPYLYNVQGKTRVRNNICTFTGSILVKQAKRYLEPHSEYPKYQYGYLICEVNFKEDSKQPGSGTIKGKLSTNWYLNEHGQFAYDTLIPADGFDNNQCVARWTPYKGGISKVCNWGDFKIPQAGGLDFSVSEFMVNKKYEKNGWQNYVLPLDAGDSKPAANKARTEEKRQWWK